MSSLDSTQITVKELKEVYELMTKDRLVEIIVEKTLEIRRLSKENLELTMKL